MPFSSFISKCGSADSSNSSSSLPGHPSPLGLCVLLPKEVNVSPTTTTRRLEGLFWPSLKWCTEGTTLGNYLVTSPPCPSLDKSGGLQAGLSRDHAWRVVVRHLDCKPACPPDPPYQSVWRVWSGLLRFFRFSVFPSQSAFLACRIRYWPSSIF